MKDKHKLKIGILGGGQLGKMLSDPAHRLGLDIHFLDKDRSFPAGANNANFEIGDFTNYDDVIQFGEDKDIISVEIEKVNTAALETLAKAGKKVYPQAHLLNLIKDKGTQKQFYADNGFPSSDFKLYEGSEAIIDKVEQGEISFPFVQKARTDGYDGKGVAIIQGSEDFSKLMDVPCLVEECVDIEMELSVIVARNPSGEIKSFPVVEMVFHPTANLVEFLCSPARISEDVEKKCTVLAEHLAEKMSIVGLLAVELFLAKDGRILVNEVAPRPHNSGHQTIEGNVTSQYEQHLRTLLDLPLGDTKNRHASVMLNILGEEGHTGIARYEGFEDLLSVSMVYPHLYGKLMTKPFRKMGHITILGDSLEETIEKANSIKEKLKVVT